MARPKSSWRKEWKDFAAEAPGRRFRRRHERKHASAIHRPWWRKVLNLGGGVLLLAVGAFFTIAPGPAIIFFVLGGLLIANESHVAARVLDKIDLFIAPAVAWTVRHWRKLSPTARRVMTGCMVGCSVVGIVISVLIMRQR